MWNRLDAHQTPDDEEVTNISYKRARSEHSDELSETETQSEGTTTDLGCLSLLSDAIDFVTVKPESRGAFARNHSQTMFDKLMEEGKLTEAIDDGINHWIPMWLPEKESHVWANVRGCYFYNNKRGKTKQYIFLKNKMYMIKLTHSVCRQRKCVNCNNEHKHLKCLQGVHIYTGYDWMDD